MYWNSIHGNGRSRALLNMLAALVAGLPILAAFGFADLMAQTPTLDAKSHPKFQNDLPVIADLGLRIDATRGGDLKASMRPCGKQWLGLKDGSGNQLKTDVWGYQFEDGPCTYPGATIVAMRDVPLDVLWTNDLVDNDGDPIPHMLPVDTTLHWADPLGLHCMSADPPAACNPYTGPVPLVTHLHGGHTESASDGLPEAWFTPGFEITGPHFVKRQSHYDNDQEAGTLWYHDHALGITRLNVYAGLAGFYLLRDENELALVEEGVLPDEEYEIEMVIQDRMFTEDGQLFLPSTYEDAPDMLPPDAPEPSVVAEFFGDFILVNGMVWPKLDVEPRKYRFRVLNGSDSRFYVLEFRTDPGNGSTMPFLQIGTDDGFLEQAIRLDRLVIGPGERFDLVVDFSSVSGQDIFLRNFGPDEPFGGVDNDFDPADVASTGQIMKFVVGTSPSNVADAEVAEGKELREEAFSVPEGCENRRELLLFEGVDELGRLKPMLGTLEAGALNWDEEITENPALGATEIWEFYNTTADAHPIHLHLVAFEVLERQLFTYEQDPKTGETFNVDLGDYIDPLGNIVGDPAHSVTPGERGPKDTVHALPGDPDDNLGQVTRVRAYFDRPGRYVWHCHILSHEDHEMMRPYEVTMNPAVELGTALGYGYLGLEKAKLKMSSSKSGVYGDVGAGPDVRDEVKDGFITGSYYVDPDARQQKKTKAEIGAGIVIRDLLQVTDDALEASKQAAELTLTEAPIRRIKESKTLEAKPGLNVLEVGYIDLGGKETLTLKGGPCDEFVINVYGMLKVRGGSRIKLEGGLLPSKVLFNMAGSKDVDISGKSRVAGTFLVPKRKAKIRGGSFVEGSVITGKEGDLSGGSRIRLVPEAQ